jgi:hypothetical protein
MTKPPQDDHYQKQMTKSYISCYNMPYKDLQHFEVPEPVYIYIRQLENEIFNRNGAVQRLYDFRFGEEKPIGQTDYIEFKSTAIGYER